jgi:murein L,D-transpeptidase YcbB/YkuD
MPRCFGIFVAALCAAGMPAAYAAPTPAAMKHDMAAAAAAVAAPEPLPQRLRDALEAGTALTVAGQALDASALARFYALQKFDLVWAGHTERVAALSAAIAAAAEHGFEFNVPATAFAAPGARSGGSGLSAGERDLLLTQVALRYASVLAVGRVRPSDFETDWAIGAPAFDAVAGLSRAIGNGTLAAWYAGLPPTDISYQRLRAALAHYNELAQQGGWGRIKNGASLKPGMVDERVPAIRARLVVEGDLPASELERVAAAAAAAAQPAMPAAQPVETAATVAAQPSAGADSGSQGAQSATAAVDAPAVAAVDPNDPSFYDDALAAGVKRFQARHGIVPDGAIGPRTLASMNVPVKARIDQIAANLERWRSLPRDLLRTGIVVNVPAATLDVVESGTPVMSMKVVVGDPQHPTPVLRTAVAAVVFNPAWTIPASIIANEISLKVKKDPHYLAKNQMAYVSGKGLQQLPGPKNPLGQIKFDTPNKFDVYLHDTNSRGTFERFVRAQSHGCVRTERAKDLAAYVLQDLKIGPEDIDRAIASSETSRVELVHRLRVQILYATAFVDPDGTVEFRDDVYGRDKRLMAVLGGSAPALVSNAAPPSPPLVPKAKPAVAVAAVR